MMSVSIVKASGLFAALLLMVCVVEYKCEKFNDDYYESRGEFFIAASSLYRISYRIFKFAFQNVILQYIYTQVPTLYTHFTQTQKGFSFPFDF